MECTVDEITKVLETNLQQWENKWKIKRFTFTYHFYMRRHSPFILEDVLTQIKGRELRHTCGAGVTESCWLDPENWKYGKENQSFYDQAIHRAP